MPTRRGGAKHRTPGNRARRRGKGTSQTQRPVSPQRTSYEAGRRIREMRRFDMTQEEFTERIGISQNYLSTMERGKAEIGAEILLSDDSFWQSAEELAELQKFPRAVG